MKVFFTKIEGKGKLDDPQSGGWMLQRIMGIDEQEERRKVGMEAFSWYDRGL